MPRGAAGMVALRLAAAVGTVVAVYIAAQFAQAPHAGWVAAGLGLPLAALAAFRVPAAAHSTTLAASAPPPASAPVRGVQVVAIAVPLCLLVLLPVLLTWLPADDDYPNHLARIQVMALHGRDALLAQFYVIRWKLIPNLGMELLLPPLAAATGVFFAGKLFLIVTMLLLMTGPLAIAAALFGRASFGPLAAVLFAYNGISKMGVLNYEFGIGLMLFAVAGWVALRARPAVLRAVFSLGCVLVLFFCHLEALGCYGLVVGSYELWYAVARPRPSRALLVDAAALVLPFAPAIPLLLLGPGKGGEYATPTHWGGLHARIDGLRFLLETYDPTRDLLAMLAMAAGFMMAVRRRLLFLHPFGWVVLAVTGFAYLTVPNELHGTWGAADRLPIATLLVLLGALRWQFATPGARAGFLVALWLLAGFRTAAVAGAFARYDRVAENVEASLALIPRGSRVLVATVDTGLPDALVGAIDELPLLAMIERSCLVSLAYAHPEQQILSVVASYRGSTGGFDDQPVPLPLLLRPPRALPAGTELPFAPSGRIYWRDWPRTYDFVYVIDRGDPASPAPGRLQLVYRGNRFELFRVGTEHGG